MIKEFKITIEDQDNESNLLPYVQAEARESFLFELFNNFFREWKNTDGLIDIDDVKQSLFELKFKHNINLINE
jgi:hypothetical protein